MLACFCVEPYALWEGRQRFFLQAAGIEPIGCAALDKGGNERVPAGNPEIAVSLPWGNHGQAVRIMLTGAGNIFRWILRIGLVADDQYGHGRSGQRLVQRGRLWAGHHRADFLRRCVPAHVLIPEVRPLAERSGIRRALPGPILIAKDGQVHDLPHIRGRIGSQAARRKLTDFVKIALNHLVDQARQQDGRWGLDQQAVESLEPAYRDSG